MSAVTEIADEFFDLLLDRFPIGASFMGVPGYDDRLTDFGRAAERRFADAVAALAARARAVPDEGLSHSDRITKRVIAHEAEVMTGQIEGRWLEFTVSDLLLTPVAGLLTSLSDVPVTDDFPKRLAAVPAALATIAQRQREGLADDLTPVAHLVQATIEYLDRHLSNVDTFVRSEACRPAMAW
ncbi:DUF885 family protein [Kutzneria kofuensis]|uniref:Uncharacterized protein (DUF885 family) n=1 Tax=Kutzneria kofuensis TaxID=103725 RepID=A0A7W9KBH0_9PSEU|nr:DUF885 family protein [Kutzneria kofuensis]MBB5889471.1 uncharacterized protein (DUF885 family) [Kutzneria kofuensis]